MFGSIWSPRDDNSHFIIYTGSKKNNKVIYAVLEGDKTYRTDEYEAEWNGMW